MREDRDWPASGTMTRWWCPCLLVFLICANSTPFAAVGSDSLSDDAPLATPTDLAASAEWRPLSTREMADWIRIGLDLIGVAPSRIDAAAEDFLRATQVHDAEALGAWVRTVAAEVNGLAEIVDATVIDPIAVASSLDPSGPKYATIESLPPELRSAIRTWIGRELVRSRFYDEALPVFAEVDPLTCPDAASLLFYRGSCYHALLKRDEALRDLRQLLRHEDHVPVRFARTASLMVADLKPLKEDSLDEISRMMTDVTRRLELGRASEETRTKEQAIIDKLTKMIEDLEKKQQEQQQQQQQSGGDGSQGQNSGDGGPMEDSRIAGANGQGDVDRKSIDDRAGWGNLPPAQRQESIQQISRDLPTHYRDAIEAYFRKLASQND